LRDAPLQPLFEGSTLLSAHAFRCGVVQVDAHFTAIRQIDRFVDDDLAVHDVSLQRSHLIKIHERISPHPKTEKFYTTSDKVAQPGSDNQKKALEMPRSGWAALANADEATKKKTNDVWKESLGYLKKQAKDAGCPL
jgi:hypothetical protein